MTTQQESGLTDSSQWSSDATSPVGGIPNAWLKAEAALQKVQQTKKATISTSVSSAGVQSTTDADSVANMYSYQYAYWSQMCTYPPYGTMPNYSNYYGMAYPNMGYSPYYTYPAMTAQTSASVLNQSQTQPSMTSAMADATQTVDSVALSDLANPPPPPPASTPPPTPEVTKASFISQRGKQAPGAGGIRFTMPKRTTPKGNGLLDLAKKKARTNHKVGSFNGLQKNSSFEHFSSFNKSYSPDKKDSDEEALEHLGLKSDEIANGPPSLKNYMKRCYASCSTKVQRDRMAIILKEKLGRLLKTGSLLSKDWTTEPLLNLGNDSMNKEQELSTREKAKFSSSLVKSKSYRTTSRFRSRSRSCSRSRSPSPYPRRVIRRREHSSGSSSSSPSNDECSSRKQSLSSSVTPVDHHNSKSNSRSNKKKKNKKKVMSFVVDPEEQAANQVRLQRRAARFKPAVGKKGSSLVLTVNNLPDADEADIDWGSYAIVGTCTDIEKPFLRITSAVDPSSIRPQRVLEKSLAMVKEHWKKHHDYSFACEQLKSIRQDLVVQCIRNSFTVQAYETHARIALEKGDRTEFNQCQSQLKVLYEELMEGSQDEFLAYRIIYNMHTSDTRELKNIISFMSPEDKQNDMIKYALSLNSAWMLNNFHKFFKLYVAAPKMTGFMIDWFVGSVRKYALKVFVKSFRPTLPVAFLERELGFSSPQECRSFLDEYSLVYTDDRSCLSCKESQASILA